MKPTTLEAIREMHEATEKFINGDDVGLVYCKWPIEITELLMRELTIELIINPMEATTVIKNMLIMMFHLGIVTNRNDWEWTE